MDSERDEVCIRWIMKYFSLLAHILEKILIIPLHDDIDERMLSHTCLDEDIFLELLHEMDCMIEFLLHTIVRDREI